jgi:hypothetical protein
MRVGRSFSVVVLVTLALSVASAPGSAAPGFREQVHVLWAVTGGQAGALFGWAVSELDDVDGDGVDEAIVSAVVDGPSANGAVFVYSGGDR